MDEITPTSTRSRLIKGVLLKWTETTGWLDRDGEQPIEGPYILVGMDEGLQRWKNQTLVDERIDKPLPDVAALNDKIPVSQWEPGPDGKPKPPWSHQRTVYLFDPATGQVFTHMNNTVGLKILFEQMEERQFYMRRLRGPDVYASVKLGARLFKTANWGQKYRPDLIIESWVKFSGDGGGMLPKPSPAPQLPPATAASPPPAAAPSASPQSPASFTTTTSPKASPPPSKPATPPKPPPAPRPAATGTAGVSFLQPVEKPSLSEELNDELPPDLR